MIRRMCAGLALALVCVFWADVASYAATETTATIGEANGVSGSWWGEGAFVACADHVAGATHTVEVPAARFVGPDQTGATQLEIEVFLTATAPDPGTSSWTETALIFTHAEASASLSIEEGTSYRICLTTYQAAEQLGRVMTAGYLGDDIESTTPTDPAPDQSVVALSDEDRALMTAGFGLLVLLAAANSVSGWMRAG